MKKTFWHKPDSGMQRNDPPLENIQAASEEEAWKIAEGGEIALVLKRPLETDRQKQALLKSSAERRRSR